MNETHYHQLADSTLDRLEQALEKADAEGSIELEYQNGMMTIALDDKQFIVSKHAPTRQLWLSSPVSGGLHFSYDEMKHDWQLADGRGLSVVLIGELGQMGVVL